MAPQPLLGQMKRLGCSDHTPSGISAGPAPRLRLKIRPPTPKTSPEYKIRKLRKEFRITKATLRDGSYGSVKAVYRDEKGKIVKYAAKFFTRHEELESVYKDRALKEFDIARGLNHPNIIETVSLCKHRSQLCLVMECCEHGDLFDLLEMNYLRLEDKKCLFKQMLRGIAYMHGRGIAHHDIKLDNMVLSRDSALKIIDFGLSKEFMLPPNDKGERLIRSFPPSLTGTQAYFPPEIAKLSGVYDARHVDIWACAVTGFVLFTGSHPWEMADEGDEDYCYYEEIWRFLLEEIPYAPLTGDNSPLPRLFKHFLENIPEEGLASLLLRMLHPFPEQRITIFEALEDPWLRDIECCIPESGLLSSIRGVESGDSIPRRHDHLPPRDKHVPESD
ncbi:kinase-like domain-containing protein [Aspergillus coremiiformis]|uniref:Kinase-like domain-containing protein n=1 Tax=Aspergillus coremiiformis TaxID=138285 RepID=A0A5N6Z0F0_9EURO|nr:kinase-like domain-containing protein [Aspergillus coremiiformis]